MTRQMGEVARPVDTVAKENGWPGRTTVAARVRYHDEPLVEDPQRVEPVRAMGTMGIDETNWLPSSRRVPVIAPRTHLAGRMVPPSVGDMGLLVR